MEKARSFLESQIALYERQLRDAEKKLAEFKAANLEYTSAGKSFLQRVEAARNAFNQERQELSDVQATRERMQQQLGTIPQFIPTDSQPQVVINNERILSSEEDLKQRIREVERTLDALLGRYTAEHPDVKSTSRTLEKLNTQLKDEALLSVEAEKKSADDAATAKATGQQKLVPNQVYETLKLRLLDIEAFISTKERRVKSTEAALKAAEEQAVTAPAVEARLADLNRDYDVIKSNYEQLLTRRESAKIAQAVDAETDIQFRIVDPPRIPTIPTGPNRSLFASIVLLAALGSGIAFAYLLTQMDVSFTNIASLRGAFSLPILGAASNIVVERRRGLRVFEVTSYIAMYGVMLALYAGVLRYSDEISRGLRGLGLEKLL